MTTVKIINWEGETRGEYALNPAIFDLPYNQKMVHEVIRWQLNKKRQAIQQAKVRSDVAGAHRKIRAQKGTGRARQGDGKACHFRGGGVAFGINPRTYEFKLNKKFVKKALCSFLSEKVRNGEVLVVDCYWTDDFNKTKFAKEKISKVTNGVPCTIISDSFDNTQGLKILHNVNLLKTEGINIHSCIKGLIIFHCDSIKTMETRLLKEEVK